jgi:hypothetical protein
MKGILMKELPFSVRSLFGIFLILAVTSVKASQPAPDSAASKPITISGLLDLYTSYNFANPASRMNAFTRNFDVSANQFSLSLAKVSFSKAAEPIGFKIDLAYGRTADLVHSATTATGADETYKNIEQAYVTGIIPIGKGLTVNFGKMVTHMGAEVIESSSNLNYSRSLLFQYAIPYYHTGVCFAYPFADNFTATGYIYNGWNNVEDNNKQKTVGASLSWSPSGSLNIIGNVISGNEEAPGIKSSPKNVYEAIVNYTVSSSFSLAFDGNYGAERDAFDILKIWKGIALYGKYAFNDADALVARVETYNDFSGYTSGVIQDLKEFTLTYEHKFGSSFVLRGEYRRDWSTENVFTSKSGDPSNSQNTVTAGAVYLF